MAKRKTTTTPTPAPEALTVTETDREILSPRAASWSVARVTRLLAGSAFRPVEWATEPKTLTRQAAAFVKRVGANTAFSGCNRVEVSAAPSANARTGAVSLYAPSRLLLIAAEIDAEPTGARTHRDMALDLLAGYSTLRGSIASAFNGAASAHGFGVTFPSLSDGGGCSGITAARVAAAWQLDALNAGSPCASASSDARAYNFAQRELRRRALVALAHQWRAEATDETAHPLDRARRVRAAVRACPDAHRWDYGSDETGQQLTEYAGAEAVTDADGSAAFARFARPEDAEREGESSKDGSVTHRTEAARYELGNIDANRAARASGADASKAPSAIVEESEEERNDRLRRAITDHRTLAELDKLSGRAREAALRAAERDEMSEAANTAATDLAAKLEGGRGTDGGCNIEGCPPSAIRIL